MACLLVDEGVVKVSDGWGRKDYQGSYPLSASTTGLRELSRELGYTLNKTRYRHFIVG